MEREIGRCRACHRLQRMETPAQIPPPRARHPTRPSRTTTTVGALKSSSNKSDSSTKSTMIPSGKSSSTICFCLCKKEEPPSTASPSWPSRCWICTSCTTW
uniref:(northern house mosquito) hypothetical protein n=1 Tax=Culex pipiens TaxID=7175 RepID=A0A8D8FNL6_CULPI